MADDVYAVVDKSKKREKHSLPAAEKESTPPNSFDSPVYDVTVFSAPERNEAINSEYSMIALDNMYSTSNQTNQLTGAAEATRSTNQGLSQATTTKAEKTPKKTKSRNEGAGCKTLACIFITIAVVAIIVLICLAILFAEVLKLKTQTASMQQSPLGQQTVDNSLQLQQINQSLSNMIQMENIRLEGRLSNSIDQLGRRLNTLVNSDNFRALNLSIQMVLMQFRQDIDSIEYRTQFLVLGQSPALPAPSCSALPPSSPSGYYWVSASNGSAVRVYCDMTRSCGNVTGGWMRIASLDFMNASSCPDSFCNRTDSNIRTCGVATLLNCSSVTFNTYGIPYNEVCGKILAYQYGSTDAFRNRTINSNYVDGVSLTHGTPREHIWTFVAAVDEAGESHNGRSVCECSHSTRNGGRPPIFVGQDYFCDSGVSGTYNNDLFFNNSPLWDGLGCGTNSTCCSFNNPPWFFKQLPSTTCDAIEMRACVDEKRSTEDIAMSSVEIYVQ